MFILAFLIGIYSYLAFFCGLFGLLTKENVILFTIGWLVVILYFERKYIASLIARIRAKEFSVKHLYKNKLFSILAGLIVFQAVVNLIGALAPELAFDALWYHLTLPKLYLLQHSVFHIPGGLLYYSDMPKVGEMIYTGALALGNEVTAKVIHFLFGLLICVALYKISRKFLSPVLSMVAVVIFYSNLVVAWESTTAYIDLIRTFFETMSLWGFINWYQTEKRKWLIISAVMIGFAITTKLLAVGTAVFFVLGIILFSWQKKKKLTKLLLDLSVYGSIAFIIPLPWFIFSFIHTGNPVYPFFTHIYEVTSEAFSVFEFFKETWILFTQASDPISPVYLISFPLLFVTWAYMKKEMKYLVVFSGLALIVWYVTPRSGGGRFIIPYLPVFSILVAAMLEQIIKNKKKFGLLLQRVLLGVILFTAFITILYRGVAEVKYVPVVFGMESRQSFLTKHLNFSFGDFYDTDHYFNTHIKKDQVVLLYGFHNLYYVDFPFIDNSWVQKGDQFDYIAVQNTEIPKRFGNWKLVYTNQKTLVKLYKPPQNNVCAKRCVY